MFKVRHSTITLPRLYIFHLLVMVLFLLLFFFFSFLLCSFFLRGRLPIPGDLLHVGQHVSHQGLLQPLPHLLHQLLLLPAQHKGHQTSAPKAAPVKGKESPFPPP